MKVNFDIRNNIGSRKSGRLRAEGSIPAIIYGNGFPNYAVSLNEREVEKAIRERGENALIKMDINGKLETTMIKEIQRAPLGNKIIHIDLQQVDSTEKIQTQVPVILIGKEQASKDGVLQQQLDEVDVECLAIDIPRNITIDIAHLTVGNSYSVSDIKIRGGFSILNDGEEVIASVVASTLQKEDTDLEQVEASEVPEVGSQDK